MSPVEREWSEAVAVMRARRVALGLTQADVAERANRILKSRVITEQTVQKFEAGNRSSFRGRTLVALGRGLNWPGNAIELLLSGADPTEFNDFARAQVSLDNPDDHGPGDGRDPVAALEARVAELEQRLADALEALQQAPTTSRPSPDENE